MTVRAWALAIACVAGCGDNLPSATGDPLAARSGTRLMLQSYRYDDGTEQVVATEAYDTELHARCRPLPWTDGTVRCVPVADDAVYVDPACTSLIGLGQTVARPTHFVAYDAEPAGRIAARVFRAGAPAAAITQYYQMVGGACTGPVAVQLTRFFAIGDELGGDALVALHDAELGTGRLAVRLRESDDGLRVPSGLRDRDLAAGCAPALHSDGRAVCEPAGAADAAYFTDPACTMPAAAIATTAPATLARLVEPSGCASYHRLGAASAAVYRLDGAACTAVDPPVGSGVFALGEVVDLPVVTRSLDTAAGRRLSHIVYAVGDPDVRFVDAPLLDATTGTECTPRMLRDTIRCVPATVAAMTLFTAGCTQPIRVAELAQHACAPIEYASANRPFQLLPIGDAIAASLFQTTGGTCQPYVGAPDSALHAVGAPVDLTMFEAAIYFGERAP